MAASLLLLMGTSRHTNGSAERQCGCGPPPDDDDDALPLPRLLAGLLPALPLPWLLVDDDDDDDDDDDGGAVYCGPFREEAYDDELAFAFEYE